MSHQEIENSIEKFSQHFKNALKAGSELAGQFGHLQVEPDHILFGLISERGSIGAETLLALKLNQEKIRATVQVSHTSQLSDFYPAPGFSENTKKLIAKAVKIAYVNKHKYVGTEHLLAALLQSENQKIKKILLESGINEDQLSQRVASVLKSVSKLPEITENFKEAYKFDEPLEDFETETRSTTGVLDYFGKNLTTEEAQKKIDPVIGRKTEIDRIIEILCRRTKNNPLLLGDPGVGKTAIIEGLAKKILKGDVPNILAGKKIYTLEMTSLVAGTTYRGEFESRIKQLLEELLDRPDIILFIDEIHTIVGAGSASGSMDAANILKPALARGELRCIGATTFTDYRKSIENDPALERRFQTVKIEEPDTAQAKEILLGVKEYFENFHHVKISDEAVESAVELSQRFLPEKFLPDKAVDLIDEASAAISAKRAPTATEKSLKEINQKIIELEKALREAIFNDNLNLAVDTKKQLEEVSQQTKKLQEKLKKQAEKIIGQIETKNIAKIVAKAAGLPETAVLSDSGQKFLSLEKNLNQKIIGQNEALNAIIKDLKRAKTGLSPVNRPLASFLFVGPSGVGKTHTAKILAQEFFGDERALIRIDMSEYGEKFNVSKLIGAPAGYVGYKESGQLTEKIRHRPYSLVLLDEIEKANREIFDLLLQILEDGHLTDAAGRKINFKNTIIVMTSNLGSQFFQNKKNIGFGQDDNTQRIEDKIKQEAKNWFKPEFLARLDKIVFFNNLDEASLKKIIAVELSDLSQRLNKARNISLKHSSGLIGWIVKKNASLAEQGGLNQGARGIKKIIQTEIEPLISDKILSTNGSLPKTIQLNAKNGIIKAS